MGTLIVVDGDKVEGTDVHNVSGPGTDNALGTPAPYTGTANYDYVGSMTDQLSDFVMIDSKPVAVVSSQSSLNIGEDIPPAGGHSGPAGSSFNPPETSPITATIPLLQITDPVGVGVPSSGTGSSFVKIGSVKVLLDGDSIDTCDGLGGKGNSMVTAENQDFVTCLE
ncbi:MAG: hypothetical protein PVG39_04020 [Desulfobacteraceae bacterium]